MIGHSPQSRARATLFLMVGLPGSGKTTVARQLEASVRALRLSPDEWLIDLGFDGYDESARAKVEALQWQLALQALALGVNVVLEFGFWSREERDAAREKAASVGAQTELRYLDVPRDELLRRLAARSDPRSFVVTAAHLDEWFRVFDPPTTDELGITCS